MIILGISILSSILIGALAGMAAGFTLAVVLLRKSIGNKISYEIRRLRAKKDGRIDIDQDNDANITGRKPREKRKTRRSRKQ